MMKVALVHDYLKEYGGAERVLEALTEIFPEAPIYTAFYKKESGVYKRFANRKIITSWAQNVPFFADKLHSPLRFLAPLIWGSFMGQLADYDVVISSASWYITKGFGTRGSLRKKPIEICYCHTPPRWLYGYTTSINFQKYPLVKAYAKIVGHFMRLYDFKQAQKVDFFVANSQETAGRIKKFYKRESIVIYPPATLLPETPCVSRRAGALVLRAGPPVNVEKEDYYFMVSRLVGGKGLEIAVEAALKGNFKLKIAGSSSGYYSKHKDLLKKSKGKVEFLGQVNDEELSNLYSGAKAFLALSKDEDFGITPVESMLCGIPVIAFNGGGYKETVLQGKTGLLFDDLTVDGLCKAVKTFEGLKLKPEDCLSQAQKFSKERFNKEISNFVKIHR